MLRCYWFVRLLLFVDDLVLIFECYGVIRWFAFNLFVTYAWCCLCIFLGFYVGFVGSVGRLVCLFGCFWFSGFVFFVVLVSCFVRLCGVTSDCNFRFDFCGLVWLIGLSCYFITAVWFIFVVGLWLSI